MGAPATKPTDPSRLHFRRRHRLRHKREFEAIYAAKLRKHRGPLTVFALPNTLPNHRLGLSVPKRVGSAPTRNRVKRCLREAFRLLQEQFPVHSGGCYDLIVVVRPHEGLSTSEYEELLLAAVLQLHNEWEKRGRREEGRS